MTWRSTRYNLSILIIHQSYTYTESDNKTAKDIYIKYIFNFYPINTLWISFDYLAWIAAIYKSPNKQIHFNFVFASSSSSSSLRYSITRRSTNYICSHMYWDILYFVSSLYIVLEIYEGGEGCELRVGNEWIIEESNESTNRMNRIESSNFNRDVYARALFFICSLRRKD